MRRGGAPSVSCRTHGHHRSAHHPRLAMQIRRCDQEYATGTFSLSFKQKVAHRAIVAHVLAAFHRMFWMNISACFGCILARVSDVKVRLLCLPRLWRHLFTAAGSHWWQRRQGTHTATTAVNARMKGPEIREAPTVTSGRFPVLSSVGQTPELFRPSSRARAESSGTEPAWLPALTMRLEPSTKTTDGFTVRTRDSGTWA